MTTPTPASVPRSGMTANRLLNLVEVAVDIARNGATRTRRSVDAEIAVHSAAYELADALTALRAAVEAAAYCTAETEHIKPTVNVHFATHRLSNDEHPADALVRWFKETKPNG